jgi:hypothetical protein
MRINNQKLSEKNNAHATALIWLSLTIFLLMAAPKAGYKIGPLPIYVVDFPAFITWYYARQINNTPKRYPLQGLVIFILTIAVISELIAGIRLGTLLQPVYIIVRTALAVSLFFSTSKIIQSKSDLLQIMKAGLLGAVITALFMVMTSLPPTRGLAIRILSIPFLDPSANRVASYFEGAEGMGARGQSLVGVSILSGAFLNTIWPLLFLLRSDQKLGAQWRIAMIAASVLIPMGVVMSYSRGAIAGLLSVIIIVTVLSSNKVRQPIVLGAGIVLLIFFWVGWDSEYFRFEWLQTKTEYQLQHANESIDMTQRIYSYSEPFDHVFEHPEFLFFGQGFARWKVSGNFLLDGAYATAASHSVFAAAYYGYGMSVSFAYVLLLIRGIMITWGHAVSSKNDFLTLFARAMFASLSGFFSWFILGHAAVSEPRGAMLLFFVFGLIATQQNFASLPETVLPETKDIKKFDRRYPRLAATQSNHRDPRR